MGFFTLSIALLISKGGLWASPRCVAPWAGGSSPRSITNRKPLFRVSPPSTVARACRNTIAGKLVAQKFDMLVASCRSPQEGSFVCEIDRCLLRPWLPHACFGEGCAQWGSDRWIMMVRSRSDHPYRFRCLNLLRTSRILRL